jgi:transposase InsO family protein
VRKPAELWVFHLPDRAEVGIRHFTYLHTTDGWVYLTTVMDLFDRRIVGWAAQRGQGGRTYTIAALTMAFTNYAADEGRLVPFRPGVQYCAQSFRVTLGDLCPTVRQSMSRKGACWDNAMAESFFKTVIQKIKLKHMVMQQVKSFINQSMNSINIGWIYVRSPYSIRILQSRQ